MSASNLGKRKAPPKSSNFAPARPAKYAKVAGARKILTQSSDKAINQNGELKVASFIKAREFEIKAMEASMISSKKALSQRAFQQVPRSMRRRTASHNVKRVPKRLRARAIREMKDDNTPTVTARRRVPTNHKRLRLAKAKTLKKLGTSTKKKRASAKEQKQKEKAKSNENVPEDTTTTEPRLSKLRKNTLTEPSQPPARFRKRQIHKSWLPTHVWHAKRAKMTEPKAPLWRFAIPLSPTDKCFRSVHRASTLRGCVADDTSYMGTIVVDGCEKSLIGLLTAVGVMEAKSMGRKEQRWRGGTRSWDGWIRERDGERRWIAPVVVLWCIVDEDFRTSEAEKERQKVKRKLLIRVHPSAFLEVWNEVLKVAKIQKPQAMVEDLRFEIGSIEITGPGAMEALVGILHPISPKKPSSADTAGDSMSLDQPTEEPLEAAKPVQSDDEDWVDIPDTSQVFHQLASITNPATLPPNAILDFSISDPRLHHPPRTYSVSTIDDDSLLNLLSTWPPDHTTKSQAIFNRIKRLTASRLASQKAINRRKAEAGPGNFPSMLAKDPEIPVMLIANHTPTPACAGRERSPGSYTLLLPWACVQPVWYSLMHYPLSTGGTPQFGGLLQKRQLAFESQTAWFPGDFPGTKAGWAWEMMEREKAKTEWQRKPKGKRCEWESVSLGGQKGETGLGWGCDWERLMAGGAPKEPEAVAQESMLVTTTKEKTAAPQILPNSEEGRKEKPAEDVVRSDEPAALLPPPAVHYFTGSAITSTAPADIPPTAVTPIHLIMFSSGHPSRNARIYRLPTTSTDLRARWLALIPNSVSSQQKEHNKPQILSRRVPLPRNASQHAKAQRLAASLITPVAAASHDNKYDTVSKPGDPNYPSVPDEMDLIGFVTSANFQLGEGRCEAIGNIAIARVVHSSDVQMGNAEADHQHQPVKKCKKIPKGEEKLCIVRDAGQTIGRLAKWSFI